MTSVALSGANGFLGWHVRAALREAGADTRSIAVGRDFNLVSASHALSGTSRMIHLAGVNRGTDEEVRDGNLKFARQAAEAIARSDAPPNVFVFANSTQATNGSTYGEAKAAAAGILRTAAEAVGADFHDVLLPNLFGEHGRPFYNSVTSTFCHLLAKGERPTVDHDKLLRLLHAQDAADLLLGVAPLANQSGLEVSVTVTELLERLEGISSTYRRGEIPDVAAKFDRDLFNTYRSFSFPEQTPVSLKQQTDSRGSFVEIIRSHGGSGQSSFSTTCPGISRGDHFHRRKVERFTVLAGQATIALRKLFSAQVFEFQVTGDRPVAVDMPTMWSHKITNTGADSLYTSFWTNDLFNTKAPDTIAEAV